ncbi:MAG TPA: YihY/virulence factor BrkB family protein [Vicinamibacterales bacterium]|nr:YihY/virulence factor BrkB family protein [Vicinamibacterales bacterium]
MIETRGRGPRVPAVARLAARARAELRLTLHACWAAVVGVYKSNDLTFASSIAYYALLSLFPFFLLVFSVLGWVTADDRDRAAALQLVLRYFPRQFEFITRQLDALRQSRVPLGLAGTVVMTWAAMGFFSAISSAVNHAWKVERQPSYFKHKLVAFLMLLAASLLLLAGLLLVSAIKVVEASWFAGMLSRLPALHVFESLLIRWGATLLFILVVGLVFYFVPNARVRFRDVWVGAVVTGVLWRLAFEGFSWYVRDLSRFSVHGSIAAVVVFLLWIYVSAVILLYGVEFTAANARLRRRRPEELPAAPAPRT